MIDPDEFAEEVAAEIPAEWYMFSSAADGQHANEVYNVNTDFNLPDPAGKEGGACTAAFLQALYRDERDESEQLSYVALLRKMRDAMDDMGFHDQPLAFGKQKPQLSSSVEIDVNKTMHLVPPGCVGNKRALLVGINYVGQKGELRACHNDVNNMTDFLIDVHDFKKRDMLILMDDGKHKMPTKKNIMTAFRILTSRSKPGDVVFVHFSGHGGQTQDLDGDEDDGMDETIIPVDFETEGQIVDDDILKVLVKPMRPDVHCVALIDCCNSGTVMDLPYVCGPEHDEIQMESNAKLQPKYKTLVERIQHNDKTLLELILGDPSEFPSGEKFDELCLAISNNWTIESVFLEDFLDAYSAEEKDKLFAAIGSLEENQEIHINTAQGISFQQLEDMVMSSRNLRVIHFSATQFNNNGQDYKAFIEVLRGHPKVKKYNFDKCFFADKKERPPYVPKLRS